MTQTQTLHVNRPLRSLQHFVDLEGLVLEFDLEVFPVVAFALAHFVAKPRDGGVLQSGLWVPVLWNLHGMGEERLLLVITSDGFITQRLR